LRSQFCTCRQKEIDIAQLKFVVGRDRNFHLCGDRCFAQNSHNIAVSLMGFAICCRFTHELVFIAQTPDRIVARKCHIAPTLKHHLGLSGIFAKLSTQSNEAVQNVGLIVGLSPLILGVPGFDEGIPHFDQYFPNHSWGLIPVSLKKSFWPGALPFLVVRRISWRMCSLSMRRYRKLHHPNAAGTE